MKKVLITGNKGFVGGNLTSFLQHKNKQIKGVSREPNAEEVSYKNLTSKTLNDTSTLIHLAGKAHDLKNSANDNEYFEVNTNLTKRMFDLFMESTCKVFIYMSSVKASADEVLGVLLEDATPNPITAYGKSKLAAEKYILSKQIPQNKRVYILRPCMVHGPNNKGNLNLLYNIVSKRIPWFLGLFENKRSYCSVRNLSFIINELIENKNIPSGIYNISDDNPMSTNEVIRLISFSQNRKSIIWNIPKTIVRILARIGNIFSLPLNSERLNKLTESYIVSNEKIKKAISKPLIFSSKDGLLDTFRSFKINSKTNKT